MESYMRHIRNFLHNISDIALAVIIVLIAVAIIFWRMQIILDYPKTVMSDQTQTEQAADDAASEDTASD